MNKIVSIFIILIIIYLSYDYCSTKMIEGQTTMTDEELKEQDKSITVKSCEGGPVSIGSNIKANNAKYPCQYKNISCVNKMEQVSTNDWGDNWHGSGNKTKQQCQLCVMGSDVDGNTSKILSNVGKNKNNPIFRSNFANDLCDAMVAGCDSRLFYANNKQDGWNIDCRGVENTSWTDNKLNKAMCAILKNSIIQFFLGFMGGLECTLKIKMYQLQSSVKKQFHCGICKIPEACSDGDKKKYNC